MDRVSERPRESPRHPGLSEREAARRLEQHGPNAIERRERRNRLRDLAAQLTHPLAVLLWVAAALAWTTGIASLALAIVAVIVLNAVFAFGQELEAERATEALREFLPPQARVRRGGEEMRVDAATLVPGDLLLIEEGEAEAVVLATGMATQLGRIAALSERVRADVSPLQAQVNRVALLIAAVAVIAGAAFFALGTTIAGLSLDDSATFAIGLLVANVPEGLLPTITLALAVGVRHMARRRALVKRLTAVETLGSTDVICTDKTGTLTEGRMSVHAIWAEPGILDRPPRPRRESIVTRAMLARAWVWLGMLEAALVLGGFFLVLIAAGWSPGDPTGTGSALHDDYLVATTMTFAGITACQVGTAFAARSGGASLRRIGPLSNPLLLWGIAFELAFAAALIYLPPLQNLFGTAALEPWHLALLAPFPVLVWGSDELRRWAVRRSRSS